MQSVCDDAQKQVINQQLLQRAKILAEAFQKFQRDYGGRWHPTMATIIMLAESDRLNDPANLPYLPSDINAMRHLGLMQDATFNEYCEKTKEAARPLTLREIKALREKLEPTEEQKDYKERLERQEAREAAQQTEYERLHDEQCKRPLTITFAVGDEYLKHSPKFQFGVDSKSLVLGN